MCSLKKRSTSAKTSSYFGASCMVFGCPCICIRHTGSPVSAAACSAPGSVSERISLMICAPALADWRITSALEVSTEIHTSKRWAMASTTGITRASSSSTLTSAAPGRVDSPPISMMVAPALIIRLACFTASISELWAPPSEKESGVTFRIPITWG